MRTRHILITSVAAVIGAISIGAGGAQAAGVDLFGSKSIKDDTVRSVDIKDGALQSADMSARTLDALRGTQGIAGEQGPAGPAGQSLVASHTTAANAKYGGVRVVDVPSVGLNGTGPSADGVELVAPIDLAEGTYLVSSTVQFFDFQPTTTPDRDYGVTRLFLDGEETGGISWTGEVPDDGNNAAQSSGSMVVEVPAAGGTLTGTAILRGGDYGQAGGNLIVTRIDATS